MRLKGPAKLDGEVPEGSGRTESVGTRSPGIQGRRAPCRLRSLGPPPPGASGFTLRRRLQGQFQLNVLPPGPHEHAVLVALSIVQAFIGKPTTMPSADFCAAITALAGPLSPGTSRHDADLPR